MFHTTHASLQVTKHMTSEHNVRYIMHSETYVQKFINDFHFCHISYYSCLKQWEHNSQLWKFNSAPIAADIKKTDEQTALEIQIRINTHRTLFSCKIQVHTAVLKIILLDRDAQQHRGQVSTLSRSHPEMAAR
jgi:hypothetical protein